MPLNKSVKQTIQVEMKPQPSKKKTSQKNTHEDSVSETISFVIKGKLTPIKPTFVTKKLGVGRKLLKLDKKLKTASDIPRKKAVKVEKVKKLARAVKTENEFKVHSKKVNTPAKVKKIVQPKNNSKSNIKVLVQESANKIVKRRIIKKLCDDKSKAKKVPTKPKATKLVKISETSKTETKHKNTESKMNADDLKKKKTIAKLLKQANKDLDQVNQSVKSNKLKAKIMPKNSKVKIVSKKEKAVVKQPNKIREESNSEEEEIKENIRESIPEQSTPVAANDDIKEESTTSDDNNLEQIRQSLRNEALQDKEKTKVKSKCDNLKNEGIHKKIKLKKKRTVPSKIKKANLEDHKLRKLKLYGFWNGPKRQRVASLNALAKVHCLYENEGRISMLDNPEIIPTKKEIIAKIEKPDYEKVEEKRVVSPLPQRSLRCVPGLRGMGKHWDMHNAPSSSSDESSDEEEVILKKTVKVKKEPKKVEEEKPQKKRKRKQPEVVMDLKDMVVRKRMASLNASAILAASYSQEKRSPRSPKSEDTNDTDSSDDDLMSEEGPEKKKCYEDDVKKEDKLIEVRAKPNKKVAVILNQDTDVTITGVYVNSTTRSTHHEGYCSIAGMQYRISATSHTQTAATAVATETLLQSSTTSNAQENTNAESLTPTGKSYKPLDALSNMRPPSDGAHHGHQSMGPPQHVMPISPSGVRHSCSSAFSAPHSSAYHHGGPGHHGPPPPPPPTMNGEPGYIHGYYQPAGPLITVPLGHGQPPLAKSAPLSDISPTTPSPLSSHPPHPAPSSNGDSSDSEVIITSVTAGKDAPPPPQAHSSYRYSQYPPNVPPPSYSYPYSSHYYHPTPPPPPSYPPHDVCYSPGPYVHHKFPPATYRRYLGAPQYYPPNPPPPAQDMYAVPPTHAQPSQQVVTTTPVSGSGAPYQPSVGPPPPSALMEPYPPTLVESYPAHYYPGYPPGPPSTCYTHAPPSRAVPFINGAYQSCPCPMQSCPKNGLTGPLTGDSKRSNPIPTGSMPLPPVALALPKEPTSDGPPSPARGSAGMPPPPSPAGATYRQQPTPPTKQESISPENVIPVEKKRKARVGKAMVRSNMQNTMLLMCNPIPVNCVKREIESPKEKEVVNVPEKEDIALNNEIKITSECESLVPQPVPEDIIQSSEPAQAEPPVKIEEKIVEPPKEEAPKLEPIISTVGENVKVKNMKRKLSLSIERREEVPASPPKKSKAEVKVNGSYKNLIKKNTSGIRINNGKRKLIQESKIPHKLISRQAVLNRRKAQNKRKLSSSKESINNNTKRAKHLKTKNTALSTNKNTKQNCKGIEDENLEELTESKENIKRGSATQLNVKSNQKLAPNMLDNLIAKNNVDRTIECVISSAIRTSVPKKTEKEKLVKEPLVPTSISVKKSTKKSCRSLTSRRKSKCKNLLEEVAPAVLQKSLHTLRWSNGWSWEGDSYEAKVFLNLIIMPIQVVKAVEEGKVFISDVPVNWLLGNRFLRPNNWESDETTVVRRCYPSMRHYSGDLIEIRDCVLLKAGARRNELPFVAKIASLWENPEDGEMMMSLLWYYRPEHTEQGRLAVDQPDEVFASRHKDSNSVACIDDKCFVLTFNEYCRYRKHLRRLEEGIEDQISPCIPVPEPYPRSHRQPPHNMKVSPEMVFFCRRVYDFRQKRIVKNPT